MLVREARIQRRRLLWIVLDLISAELPELFGRYDEEGFLRFSHFRETFIHTCSDEFHTYTQEWEENTPVILRNITELNE